MTLSTLCSTTRVEFPVTPQPAIDHEGTYEREVPPSILERLAEEDQQIEYNQAGHKQKPLGTIFNFVSVRDLARCRGVHRDIRDLARQKQVARIFESLSLPVVEKALENAVREFLRVPRARDRAVLHLPQPGPLENRSAVSQVVGNSFLRSTILNFLPVIDQYSCKGVSRPFLQTVESVQRRRILNELPSDLIQRYGEERLKDVRVLDIRMQGFHPSAEISADMPTQHILIIREGFTALIKVKMFPSKDTSLVICLFHLESLHSHLHRADPIFWNQSE